MTCYRPENTKTKTRFLLGRHSDNCSRENCRGCQVCPNLHCSRCRATHVDHDPDICPGCLDTTRGHLVTLAIPAARLEAEAMAGRPAYRIHGGIPGGDALVILGPGRHYLTIDHHQPTEDERPNDPIPTLALLTRWAHHWLGQTEPLTLPNAWRYLADHLHRFTQDPTFGNMADDFASAAFTLENVLHVGERPDLSRVPCWECGARLAKHWTRQEATDYWQCPRCGERYDRGRYDRAQHDHLASHGAARYVSVVDATQVVGRPVQTVRAWVRRGLVDTTRDPDTGRLMVWWPDVREMHVSASQRNRSMLA